MALTRATDKIIANADGNLNLAGIVTATTIKVGAAISMTDNAISATRFHGNGSQLTGISVDSTKIETGNTKVETIDTGSDGHIKVTTEGSERLRIQSGGNVMIGGNYTSTNLGKLSVDGVIGIDDEGSGTSTLNIMTAANTRLKIQATGSIAQILTQNDVPFAIKTDAGTGGGTERFRIATDGDIGIGVAPSARLHVSGGDGLLVERSAGTSIAGFKHTGASAMNIYFQNTGSSNHPSIGSDNQDLTLGTNNTERLRIKSNGNIGIGENDPQTKLQIAGSLCGGTSNQPFLRFFDSSDRQRNTKHYFKCVRGSTTIFDILTVDLNQNFHQALIILYYGCRLQGVSDATTDPVHKIIGVNRFNGGAINFTKQVIQQSSNAQNHADIDAVATSSTNYRIRLTFSNSTTGSSFACGSVEIIGVGSGDDGCFYSLAHSHGLLA